VLYTADVDAGLPPVENAGGFFMVFHPKRRQPSDRRGLPHRRARRTLSGRGGLSYSIGKAVMPSTRESAAVEPADHTKFITG
jgi:hypothetical protein